MLSIPAPVNDALEVWLQHHDDRAPGVIEGLYIVGSVALDNWQPHSDVDIIAVTSSPADSRTASNFEAAHTAAHAVNGIDIDGPYVTWDDLRRPPTPLHRPWTLHGEFHHDEGCFELNPVMWLTLARHGVAVRGPQPDELDIYVDDGLVRSFVIDNSHSYWSQVAPAIRNALEDPERTEFDARFTSWDVLGVARMLFTVETGDVASKTAAGQWLIERLPQHSSLVEHALAVRNQTDPSPDDRAIAAATADYLDDVISRIG